MSRKKIVIRTALATSLFAHAGASTASNGNMVPGSDRHNFNIFCDVAGKQTFTVANKKGLGSLQVARNIYVTEADDGRKLITFKHGVTVASEPGSYTAAENENCRFVER
ncbi:hypothetical protein [Pseudomonas sp. LFM046]|uniref:hypothetical protein n=1 Tax=Pseudomonas sp. LFM046 TaxID=1608357 RepID=UPI0005CFB619|nr:hypothetical protein [Pseudomonas sp. LFM046]